MKLVHKHSLDEVKDEKLDFVNIESIKSAYYCVESLLIVFAVICVLIAIFLFATSTVEVPTGTYYNSTKTVVIPANIVSGVALIICGPLFSILFWLIVKPFIAMTYDIKLIKYELLYFGNNKSKAEITEEMKYNYDIDG